MGGTGERTSFWQTLPGILTGLAAILTALTGLLVAVLQSGLFDQEARAPGAGPDAQARDIDAISGRWAGAAKDSSGTTFAVSLEIGASCTLGERCGRIRVSHVPCEGALYLHGVAKEGLEFSVDDFTPDSATACTPGAGELLKLLPDGNLLYTTSYEPKASGILRRSDD